MTVRPRRLLLAGAALVLAVSATAAPPADPPADPLPAGAKVRFGVTRPILRGGPGVALVPPGYTTFVAPTTLGGLRWYDLATGRRLAAGGPLVTPGQVVVSADARRAVVARTGALTVVDVASGKGLLTVRPPEGVTLVGYAAIALSADGRVLAYGGRGKETKGEIVVWDVDKNELLARVETAQAAPVFPVLSRDGKLLATHGPASRPAADSAPAATRFVQVWDVAAGKELFKAPVTGIGGAAAAAAFSSDSELVAVSAADGPVDLWEVKTGKRRDTLLGRKGQGVRLAFSPDGKTVASVGADHAIQRWATNGTPLEITESPPGTFHAAPVTGLVFADNNRAIAWATVFQFAVAWEAPTGRLLSPVTDHVARIRSVALPAGDQNLFTAGVDGRVLRWDLATGQLFEAITLRPTRLPGQPVGLPIVHLSANATRACWPRESTEVFDLETGAGLFSIPNGPPSVASANLSPDGRKLIVLNRPTDGARVGLCTVWDLATGRRAAELEIANPAGVFSGMAALSPDGTRLVTSIPTGGVPGKATGMRTTGWDPKTGKKLGEVEEAKVSGTVYLTATDGPAAVLVSSSGRLWSVDYEAGRVTDIDTLPAPGESAVYGGVEFSPDGKLFATGVLGAQPETYGVRVYDWPRAKALHTFWGHLGPATELRFSSDGKSLASGSFDSSILLWDLTNLTAGK